MMTASPGGQALYGDWRRRRLTKTDAHLYAERYRSGVWNGNRYDERPMCNKRIPRDETVVVVKGRPCTECLVAEITRLT